MSIVTEPNVMNTGITPRPSGRAANEIRPLQFETGISRYAEGSCLIRCGNTEVLCTASIDENVPPFLRNGGKGWITAEYSMLPRATHTRGRREVAQGKPSGRTMEIQRLIGRALRSVVNLEHLGERQIIIDCDVLQADGGTRTASITGGYVALYKACQLLHQRGQIKRFPITHQIAAISCGMYQGTPVVDLDYEEDSSAEVDANFIMTANGKLVEIQGTAESGLFDRRSLLQMMDLAESAIQKLAAAQNKALNLP